MARARAPRHGRSTSAVMLRTKATGSYLYAAAPWTTLQAEWSTQTRLRAIRVAVGCCGMWGLGGRLGEKAGQEAGPK